MRLALPLNAPFFQRNGIEVVVVMDEDSRQEELLALIQEYPFINWRVVVNHLPHEWRNPTKAINVGIRHATKKYVMVCSPESEFYTDAIYLLRNTLKEYPNHFAIGTVAFTLYGEDDSDFYPYMPYGSIMAEREHLIAIGGYDESLNRWGGDDDNIRARLEMSGIRKLILPEVKLHHREKYREEREKRRNKHTEVPIEEEIEIYHPNHCKANKDGWGRDFDDVIYDWRHNCYARQLIEKYLQQFATYHIPDNDVFRKEYNRILIVQSRNNSRQLDNFFQNMVPLFDGIILIDDGSTDDTYERALCNNLLLKIKKKHKSFDDLKNRNIGLYLASFFASEWFCFMDTDERFDERFIDFDDATSNKQADVILFGFVNMWNSNTTYNAEYPYSNNGIMYKMRMFRNIGHTQIYTDKVRFHFDVTPYKRNFYKSKIFYRHYGMITRELREKKYEFYTKEDIANDQKSYEHILNHDAKLLNVEDICCRNGVFYNSKIML